MPTYTTTADPVSGEFNIELPAALVGGEKVKVTAQKNGQTRSLNLQAPSEPYLPPSSGGGGGSGGNTTEMIFYSRVKPIPRAASGRIQGAFTATTENLYGQFSTLTFQALEDDDLNNCYSFFNWNATTLNLPSNLTLFPANCFQDWKQIVQYAMPPNIKTIGEYGLYGWLKLKNITLNNGLEVVQAGAISYCEALEFIEFPDSVTEIKDQALALNSKLKKVVFGRGTLSLGSLMFARSGQLDELVCLAETPPLIQTDYSGSASWFNYTQPPVVIKVPATSVNAYKAAPGWSSWASRITAI